jgi:serine/threonine protein kinase
VVNESDLSIARKNPHSVYSFQDSIGRGLTSTVYKATCKSEPTRKFAIKEIFETRDKTETFNEIDVLTKSKHTNVINLIETYFYRKRYYMVMELSEIPLTAVLSTRVLPTGLILYIFHEVLKALAYLHERFRVHRDVKSDNVLITRDGEIKLADFGFSV